MSTKMLILSLFSIAFLTAIALGINWNDPSHDAEEMISSGETTTITPPQGQAATPKLSRAQQENKSSLDWTMPSTLSTSDSSAKQSRAESQSESETETSTSTEAADTSAAEDNTTAATDTELPPEQTVAATAEGNWYFTLNDSVVRDLAMTVFQKDEDVYGAGKIREGNSTIDVAVSGTIANSTMELNLISTNPIVQYKLSLDLDEDWASGEYQASTAGGETWTGIADGQKTS
ncbi:MAG: hypothetical protein LUQ59_01935 [Methanothrix sp.]|nr:hypothetical protein [Methanothrix sp.]